MEQGRRKTCRHDHKGRNAERFLQLDSGSGGRVLYVVDDDLVRCFLGDFLRSPMSSSAELQGVDESFFPVEIHAFFKYRAEAPGNVGAERIKGPVIVEHFFCTSSAMVFWGNAFSPAIIS